MLLNFNHLFEKYKMKVKGVVQVGSHFGQEYQDYIRHGVLGIVFIEPSQAAFAVLQEKFGDHPNVLLFNTACGDGSEGPEKMAYTEHTNQGQSNSLLAPKVHLTQHKEVVFDGTAMWKVSKLDDLPFQRERYDMLNLDVQGYEDRVLRGATETLSHINYLYTEINRQEMYENCALVDKLDEMLPEFKRVETGWASEYHGWGDGFYVRKTLL